MHFDFYSNKNQRKESIELLLTSTGWFMVHECYKGPVEPNGRPYLQHCVEENYTEVPTALADAFQEIWEAANTGGLENGELQETIDTFSEWVANYNTTKQPSPIYAVLKK